VNVQVEVIGVVEAVRIHADDDFWGGEESCITLASQFTFEALGGLAEFSHVEVLYLFHEVEPSKVVTGSRHPRNNKAWPSVGIFAQRGKNRPNRIGSTICRVVRVEGTSYSSPSSTPSTARRCSTSSLSWQSSSPAKACGNPAGRTSSCASTGCTRGS